ncbi:T9SS type A sorting domain-containing protein [Spirosoma sordidisoli]
MQGVPSLCTAGSTVLTAAVSGGNAPATVVWTRAGAEVGKGSSLTVTQAGTYVAQVADAQGCVVSATQSVTESAGLPVSVTGSTSFCEGASTTLTAVVSDGTDPLSFQWKQGTTTTGTNTSSYTAVAAGNYTVEVTDRRGCKGVAAPVTVTQRSSPAPATVTASSSAIVTGETAILTTTVAAGSTIQWLRNNAPIPGAVQVTHIATQAGDYVVQTTNRDGCSAVSKAVTVNLITATSDPVFGSDFSVVASPNPSTGRVEIRLSSPSGKVVWIALTLIDLSGRSLYQRQIKLTGQHVESLYLEHLPAGIFLLSAKTDKQQTRLRLIRQ